MSDRYSQLIAFLKSCDIPCSDCNPCDCGCQCAGSLAPLNGDASFRRYYRLKLDEAKFNELCDKAGVKKGFSAYSGSVIVMDAPPETQKNREFFAINHALKNSKVLVPAIVACDIEQGFMVLEDFGDRDLFKTLQEHFRPAYLFKAVVEMTKIGCMPFSKEEAALIAQKKAQSQQEDASLAQIIPEYSFDESDYVTMQNLPKFDHDFMQMEMGIFTEWLLDKTLHLELSDAENEMLKRSFDFIAAQCAMQPQRAMHRDFHSRNIMVVTPGGGEPSILSRLAILDYQDMVLGPIGYDLASLAYDCYFEIEDKFRQMLIGHLHRVYSASGIIDGEKVTETDIERFVYICAIQRHIKVLGLFNRLNLRDGKSGYLKDLPRVLNYLLANCAKFDELTDFKAFLETKIQGKV